MGRGTQVVRSHAAFIVWRAPFLASKDTTWAPKFDMTVLQTHPSDSYLASWVQPLQLLKSDLNAAGIWVLWPRFPEIVSILETRLETNREIAGKSHKSTFPP